MKSQRTAMTLLELMAALTLASLLMAAVLGVLGSLQRQRHALVSRRPPQAWKQQLREQLRLDFQNARRMSVRWDELRLIGYGGRNETDGRPTHRPTEVVYAVQSIGTTTWLTRWEIHLDELVNRNATGELVCEGVSAIDWMRPEETEPPTFPHDEIATARNGQSRPSAPSEIPGEFRLLLFAEDQRSLLLDESVFLRRETRP